MAAHPRRPEYTINLLHLSQHYLKLVFRGHNAPSFMGFENQDLSHVAYGEIHVPSIALKDIPVQREQLRLKLCYGTKKVTTFNADLSQKQVSLLFNEICNSGRNTFPTASCQLVMDPATGGLIAVPSYYHPPDGCYCS